MPRSARLITPVWPQPTPACEQSGGEGCGECRLRVLRPTPDRDLIEQIGLRRLTTRQCEVLVRVLAGDATGDIAEALDLSLAVVRREAAAAARALAACPVIGGERPSPRPQPDAAAYLNE